MSLYRRRPMRAIIVALLAIGAVALVAGLPAGVGWGVVLIAIALLRAGWAAHPATMHSRADGARRVPGDDGSYERRRTS